MSAVGGPASGIQSWGQFAMKLTKNSKIAILILLLGIAFGLIISQGTIFIFYQITILTAFFAGLTLLTGISDLVTKKKYFVYPGLSTLCMIAAIGFGFIGFKVIQNQKQQTADQLIVDLKNFKTNKGKYPHDLKKLTIDKELAGFNYSTDSIGESYELSFSWDGWHQKAYNSKTRIWTVNE